MCRSTCKPRGSKAKANEFSHFLLSRDVIGNRLGIVLCINTARQDNRAFPFAYRIITGLGSSSRADWNESCRVTVETDFGRRMKTHGGGWKRESLGYRRWKKKSLQKVKSDQAEGCTIVQGGMKALD